MAWKLTCWVAALLQLAAQGILLLLLEPGFDISIEAYRAFKIISGVYLGASMVGGAILTGWITIGMALFSTAGALLLTIALWHNDAPIRAALRRLLRRDQGLRADTSE